MLKIIIVIPIYREEHNIRPLYERLKGVVSQLEEKYAFEFIFVNDGSPDDSILVLTEIAEEDFRVKVVDLSRNFGKEIALTAGVHEAEDCDALICIDADLQHPPELIPELIQKWEEGAEIVVTIRKDTEKQPILRQIGSKLYYWILNKVSDLDVVSQTTDYRLYDGKVTKVFKSATERERMFRGIMDWLGFKKVYIEFIAPARLHGEAGYTYLKLWRLAVSSITSFSLWPLKIAGYTGALITIMVSFAFFWMLLFYIVHGELVYSPLAIVILANTLFMGITLMAIGLVALYIGKIHTEVINRPLYVIRERINLG
ncbi:MAG: hypothetical protein EoVTN8_392 [Fluviibacter phosphoraccumulans EoVTN8]